MSNALPTATRTDLGDGTFQYEIDGETHYQASKVRYEAVSYWRSARGEAVAFHKTVAAAYKARQHPGNRYLKVKLGVTEFDA